MHPQQAPVFACGQFDQRKAVLVERTEIRRFRHRLQFATTGIRPAMERAHEALRIATALVNELHAAMPARVHERMKPPVCIAGRENWHAEVVKAQVAARLWQIAAQTNQLRMVAKQHAPFLRREFRIEVSRCRVFQLPAGIGVTPAFDLAQQFFQDPDLLGMMHGLNSVVVRRNVRNAAPVMPYLARAVLRQRIIRGPARADTKTARERLSSIATTIMPG